MSTPVTNSAVKATRLADLGKRTDIVHLDPRIIGVESGHNPRDYRLPENREHLDELKANIKVNGYLPEFPITVRFDTTTGKVFVVDGECRLTACNELIAEGHPIESIPTIQDKSKTPEERLIHAMIGNTGKPLSKWELGSAFKRLVNYGWSEEKIAQRMGYKERFVKEALELNDAPEAIKHLLSEQAVTPSLVLHELRTQPTDEAVTAIREKVVQARANGQHTARKTQENRLPTQKSVFAAIEKLVLSAEDDLFDDEFKFIEVDKASMRKLAGFVGITDSEKVQAKKKK